MKRVEVALEWFKNPDHLPFIAGIEQGWFQEIGLTVNLIVPDEHYDGLASVANGEIAFACNEPLHMIDDQRPGLRALGCFFETDGGVMLTHAAEHALRNGQKIRIASPVAEDVTNKLAEIIVQRWAKQQGIHFSPEQMQIESAGFEHIKNMQEGYDGAWLCFANFEGVEADQKGLNAHFISTKSVDLPNFSALELFTGEAFLCENAPLVEQFSKVLSRAAQWCSAQPLDAAKLYYQHTGETPSLLMDAIIADTCHRLVFPLQRNTERWLKMWQTFTDLGLAQVDEAGYQALYS